MLIEKLVQRVMSHKMDEQIRRIKEFAKTDVKQIKTLAAEVVRQAEEDWGIAFNSELKSDSMKESCTYCGSQVSIQQDHIIAKSKGGVATTPACKACNTSKGDKPLMTWFRWLRINDASRWKKIVAHNHGKKSVII